jgi:hypothetical protein
MPIIFLMDKPPTPEGSTSQVVYKNEEILNDLRYTPLWGRGFILGKVAGKTG